MTFRSLFRLFHSSQAAVECFSRARCLLRRDGRYIIITALPKTGSTFLSHSLAEVTGYTRCYFGFSYKNLEQELYLPKVVDAYGTGSVVHQHFRANPANLELMSRFLMRPVVLVRNILDAAVSVRDHLVGEASDNLPSVYTPAGFSLWSPERQFDFIVDFVLPWYVSFYASWKYAERDLGTSILWMRYEEMVGDWPASILTVLKFYNLDASAVAVQNAIERVQAKPRERIRLNKGVSGRGAEALSKSQIARVSQQIASYPDVDFTPLGFPAQAEARSGARVFDPQQRNADRDSALD